MTFKPLQQQIKNILTTTSKTSIEQMQEICVLLKQEIGYYNWVGFYFANHEAKTLHLGPYAGEETDHTVIPFGKGICGQVAESNATFVVPDVKAQDNYIACSITVKAEIVVPIFKDGKNIGQIDIDSNTVDPFSEKDAQFLGWICEQVAKIL
jgi:GAF domain-containing protein